MLNNITNMIIGDYQLSLIQIYFIIYHTIV